MKILSASLFALALSATALLAGDNNHIHVTVPTNPQPLRPAITPIPSVPAPVPVPSVAPIPNVTPASPAGTGAVQVPATAPTP